MTWPSFYPDDCPPADAMPASGGAYRLVETNPPRREDFRSHRDRFPERPFHVPEWQACGVSIYRDVEDIKRLRRRIRKLRSLDIAYGELEPSLGLVLPTPSTSEPSHYTWWIPVEASPWKVFSVVQVPE